MYDERALVGVGGWLAFFVIILALFTPLQIVFSTYGNLYSDPGVATHYDSAWPLVQGFYWTIAAATIAFAWYLAWRLNRVETWQTVRIVIAGIWILSVGRVLVELLGLSLITGTSLGGMMTGVAPLMVRPVLFGLIWTAYFLRSRRVANTYARESDGSDMTEVFG